MREKYQIEIEKRIENFGSGYAFSAIDFIDIAGTDPTNKALSRLGESVPAISIKSIAEKA